MLRSACRNISLYLVGATFGGGLLVTVYPDFVTPAYATLSRSCLDAHTGSDDDYGQTQGEERGADYTGLQGVRSQILAVQDVECQRISTIYVASPTGNGFFEFGYVLGWSTCDWSLHSTPTVFSAWKANNGSSACTMFNYNPIVQQWDTYRASDVNGNTYWGGYFNGIELQPQGVNLDFNQGSGGINVERGHPMLGLLTSPG